MAKLEQLQAQLKASQDRYSNSGSSDYVKQAAQNNMSNIQQQIDSQAQGMAQPAPYVGQNGSVPDSPVKAPNIASMLNNSGGTTPSPATPSTATAPTTQPTTNVNTTSWKDSQEFKDLSGRISKQEQDQSAYKTQYESDLKAKDEAYNQVLEAKRAAVKSAIQKATGKFQDQITNAPQEFQSKRDEVNTQSERNLVNIRRSLASLGYRPDSYLTNTRQSDIEMGAKNQINQLDIAQKRVIDDANRAITELQAQGNIEDANAIAEITMQKMNALDNLKQNYISNNTAMSNNIYNNIKGLMDFNVTQEKNQYEKIRNAINDETDRKYKLGTLENSQNNTLYDYITKTQQNQNTANKNKWEASGYMMPDWAQQQIPQEVLQELTPYSGDYAKAAQDLSQTNPELAQWAEIASVQKMFNNPELLRAHGSKYATLDNIKNIMTQSNKDREYNLDVNKFGYGVQKDDRDFNYQAVRDDVKDQQWTKEYGLKDWVAKDSSARGWNSNSISQQNANTNAWQAQDTSNRGWANYELSKNNSANKKSQYFDSVANTVKSFVTDLSKKTDETDTSLSEYIKKPGSVENKQFVKMVGTAVKNGNITPNEGEIFFNFYGVPY